MSGRRWSECFACFAAVLLLTAGVSTGKPWTVAALESLSDAAQISTPETLETTSASQRELETLGRQFREPVGTLSVLSGADDTGKPTQLPAVPAAISMTLCGFFCVSFVRDRRAWLAMACGIMWAGHAGILVLPLLGQKLRCRAASGKSVPKLSSTLTGDWLAQTMADCGIVRYIGLLRHLDGIPHKAVEVTFGAGIRHIPLAICKSAVRHPGRLDVRSFGGSFVRHWAAAAHADWCNVLNQCPADKAEHYLHFSSACSFNVLARGPPVPKKAIF